MPGNTTCTAEQRLPRIWPLRVTKSDRLDRYGPVASAKWVAPGNVVAASARSFSMTKLVVGKMYTLSVEAVTSAGAGAAASGTITIK